MMRPQLQGEADKARQQSGLYVINMAFRVFRAVSALNTGGVKMPCWVCLSVR